MKRRTAFLLTALCYGAGAHATHPEPQSQVVSTFGMIGISLTETARLNLVNIDDPRIINIIPNLCQAQLRFLDGTGKVLTKSDVALSNGQAGHLDLPREKIPSLDARVEIRAEVATLDSPVPASAANCVATIEIFNSRTGQTTVLYPAAPQLYLGGPITIDPPIPPFPPVPPGPPVPVPRVP